MRQDCFDIGAIQAFLDGETTPEHSAMISEHIAGCDNCAHLLSVAEEENALVFGALEREMNAMVPTQRLWSRINDSIDSGRATVPFWQRVFGALSVRLLDTSFSSAAGIVLFIAVLAGIWSLSSGSEDKPLVANSEGARPMRSVESGLHGTGGDAVMNELPPATEPELRPSTEIGPNDAGSVQRVVATLDRTTRHRKTREVRTEQPEVRPITLQYLPGEESYLKTIDGLRASVDEQKDRVLPPASRVAFERDLALVNDAINRMQDVVRKDPQNQAARQVLYAAYQDKIDLLNSVGQREELLASLR